MHKDVSWLFFALMLLNWERAHGYVQFLENKGVAATSLPPWRFGRRYNLGSRTLRDYQTRTVAYRDAVKEKCYLEMMDLRDRNRLGGVTKVIEDIPGIRRLSSFEKSQTEGYNSIEIWQLAGPRIHEFCGALPVISLKNSKREGIQLDSNSLPPLPVFYQKSYVDGSAVSNGLAITQSGRKVQPKRKITTRRHTQQAKILRKKNTKKIIDEMRSTPGTETKVKWPNYKNSRRHWLSRHHRRRSLHPWRNLQRRRSTRSLQPNNVYAKGRYRGQTQSQYLNFGVEGSEPGKAEAESSYGGSRAVVSGKNGMGSAQSQTSYGSGCEDCYGVGQSQGQGVVYNPDQSSVRFNKPDMERPTSQVPDYFYKPGGTDGQIGSDGRPIAPKYPSTNAKPGSSTNLPTYEGIIPIDGQQPSNINNYPVQTNIPGGYPSQTVDLGSTGRYPVPQHQQYPVVGTTNGRNQDSTQDQGQQPGNIFPDANGPVLSGNVLYPDISGRVPNNIPISNLKPGITTGSKPNGHPDAPGKIPSLQGYNLGPGQEGNQGPQINTNFPNGRDTFPGSPIQTGQFPGQIEQFPTHEQAGKYPVQIGSNIRPPGTYSIDNAQYPTQNGNRPSGTDSYPTKPSNYPDLSGNLPTQNGQIPGEIGRFPGQGSQYPSQNGQNYDTNGLTNGQYPGQSGTFTNQPIQSPRPYPSQGVQYPGSNLDQTGRYPSSNGQYPGASGRHSDQNGQFLNQDGQQIHQNGQYPTPAEKYPSQIGQYPNQNGYPNNNGQYPGPNFQTPGQINQQPTQTGSTPVQTGMSPTGQFSRQPGAYDDKNGQNLNHGIKDPMLTGGHPGQPNVYPGQNVQNPNQNAQHPGQIGLHPSQRPTQNGQLPSQTGQYPDQNRQYPAIGPDQYGRYPTQNGQNEQFPAQVGQYPGSIIPSQDGQTPSHIGPPNSNYPNQNGQYPSQNGQLPNQIGQPNLNYPNQNGQYPTQSKQDPDQTRRYPDGPFVQYPVPTKKYPEQTDLNLNQNGQGHSGRLPGQTGQYPGQNEQYPVQTGQYPNQFGRNPTQSGLNIAGQQPSQGEVTNVQPGINTNYVNYPQERPGHSQQQGSQIPGQQNFGQEFTNKDNGFKNTNSVQSGDSSPNNLEEDEQDSQAQTSVQQVHNETQLSASAQGIYGKGKTQTQVSGSYSGGASFSAQAQTSDSDKGAQSQISAGKNTASGSAQGNSRKNKAQVQVNLNRETGATAAESQSLGWQHGTNSQVKVGTKGGLADAQANGPGGTSSQAQIGFIPPQENLNSSDKNIIHPYTGGGTASAQSGRLSGQSQSQIQGKIHYGISYSGAAQAGSGVKDESFTMKPLDVLNYNNPIANSNEKPQKESSDVDKNIQVVKNPETLAAKPIAQNNSTRQITDKVTKATADEYDDIEDNGEDEYDEYENSKEVSHQALTEDLSNANTIIEQTSSGQKQHIVLGSLGKNDAQIIQDSSNKGELAEGMIFQPGDVIPGTQGYTIPIGFRGRVSSVSHGDETFAVGDEEHNSQAQTVTITPGTGNISFSKTNKNNLTLRNGRLSRNFEGARPNRFMNRFNLRSGNEKNGPPNYISVTNSVAGKINNAKSSPSQDRQYSHTYYTKSSTCGYFTFSCDIVYGTNGRTKVCKPKAPINPDGTPMQC